MLFNQFHDFLAGTSLEAAYESARDGFGEAMSIAGRNFNYALQSISRSIGIEQDGTTHIVVFNPHSWPSLAGVESEFGSLTTVDWRKRFKALKLRFPVNLDLVRRPARSPTEASSARPTAQSNRGRAGSTSPA
jgi:alpha-mannosidase